MTAAVANLEAAGKTAVIVAADGVRAGILAAAHTGVAMGRAGLLPQNKVSAVRELALRGQRRGSGVDYRRRPHHRVARTTSPAEYPGRRDSTTSPTPGPVMGSPGRWCAPPTMSQPVIAPRIAGSTENTIAEGVIGRPRLTECRCRVGRSDSPATVLSGLVEPASQSGSVSCRHFQRFSENKYQLKSAPLTRK
jgi:hypothetical protein